MSAAPVVATHRMARLRQAKWPSYVFWVMCGLLTSAAVLRSARNIRIADTKGTSQFVAVNEPVIQLDANTDSWLLFVDESMAALSSPTDVCNAVSTSVGGSPSVRLVWIDKAGVLRTIPQCAVSISVGATQSSLVRRAGSVMAGMHLGLMLVDQSGKYIFGGRGEASDIKAVSLLVGRT